MSTLAVVLIVLAVVLVVLIVGGLIATARRQRQLEAQLRARLAEADRKLALAVAADRGWERAGLEAAAREAFAARSSEAVRELHLVEVVDRPGTDADEAIFRVTTDRGHHELRMERSGDVWREGQKA